MYYLEMDYPFIFQNDIWAFVFFVSFLSYQTIMNNAQSKVRPSADYKTFATSLHSICTHARQVL